MTEVAGEKEQHDVKRKPVSDSEKQTKTDKLAELFGGTQKQNKEREEMEVLRREETKKKREGKVGTRVKQIEKDRAEQKGSVRKKSTSEKQKEGKQREVGKEIRNRVGQKPETIFESKIKETDLNGGNRKVGILNYRPALHNTVGVEKIKVPVGFTEKASLDLLKTTEPSTSQ